MRHDYHHGDHADVLLAIANEPIDPIVKPTGGVIIR